MLYIHASPLNWDNKPPLYPFFRRRSFIILRPMNIYQKDYRQTPEIFTLITEHRNEEAKQYLQKHRSEINLKGWMDDTPLHIASKSGNVEMAEYLIENGADVNAARSGVYATPLCWAANYEIAQLLLTKGATMNDLELYMATSTDKPTIADLLLTNGATINAEEPQYLSCKSIACMEVYLKHGIDLNGCDENRSNLLHNLAWKDLPEVFDFAYDHGCPWTKDSSQRTPYTLAKQGLRKNMLNHFQLHYATLIVNAITTIDTGNYLFEKIYFLKQCPSNPNRFITLTKNAKLVRYVKYQQELIVDQVIEIDVPTIRNFAFDKNGHLILPTADDRLLVIDITNFKLIKTIPLEEGLELDQITYLPSKNIYVGSSSHWKITILNEDFQKIISVQSENGTIRPVINQHENLIAFLSYNQETHYELYELTNDQEVNYIHTFFKAWDNSSQSFDFNYNEMAITFPDQLEYYNYENGSLNKLWEMDTSRFPSEHSLSYVVFVNADLMVLGKGKTLFFINKQNQQITATETLLLAAEICGLSTDNDKEYIIISTNEELKLFSWKTMGLMQ